MLHTQSFFALLLVQCASTLVDYSQFVNPLIGSEGLFPGCAFGGGDIFVGAAVPFGVAKVGLTRMRTTSQSLR